MLYDVIIIGGGAAGCAAAHPLVAAGHNILIIDAGSEYIHSPDKARPSLADLRTKNGQSSEHLLGRDLSSLRNVGFSSQKIRTAASPDFEDGYHEINRLKTNNFRSIGTLNLGGLTNIWGGTVCTYDDNDMETWPISARDMAKSYKNIVSRIGVSGGETGIDDIMQLTQPTIPARGSCAQLYERYRNNPLQNFSIERPMLAVLSEDKGNRGSCIECKGCMWGCHTGAVYNAAVEVLSLKKCSNFTLITLQKVQAIRKEGLNYSIKTISTSDNSNRVYSAPRIIVAAGTIPTTRLVLDFQNRIEHTVPLVTSPAFGFAMIMPRRLGHTLEEQGFGLAQLSYKHAITNDLDDYSYGLIYEGDSFSLADLIAAMPITKRSALGLLRIILPSLMVGLGYLPSKYVSNTAKLSKSRHLVIEGQNSDRFNDAMTIATKCIKASFKQLGVWVLPRSLRAFEPGADAHYAGTLPMGKELTRNGELNDHPGFFIADGAALPSLPAKNPTLTIMANADRIATKIAQEISKSNLL